MARVRLAWLPPNEAEVACGVLVSGGLDAVVIGEPRSALVGVLPPTDFQVELWVEEAQVSQARELLSAMPIESPTVSEPEPPRASKPSKLPTVVLLLIIAGLSYALWREKQSRVRPMVCVTTWLGDAKRFVHCDANRDGNDERVEVYDRQGRLRTLWLDSDEDGNAERVDEFGIDGELESRGFDPTGAWAVTMRETYGDDGVVRRVFDADADGFFERAENVMPDGGLLKIAVTRIDGGTEEAEFTDSTVRRLRWLNGTVSLEVERDGGVVRRQVLGDDGWNEVTR